jgi:uncharacterized protein
VPRRTRSRRRPVLALRFAALGILFTVSAAVAFLVACPPSRPAPSQPALEPVEGGGAPASTAEPAAPAPANAPVVSPSTAPAGVAPRSSTGNATTAAAAPRPAAQSPLHPQPEAGLLAVVIDDAGYSLSELQVFLDIPGPLTVAVLPNLPNSTEAARRVLAAGKDLILHCPMEPVGGENPGPGALLTSQTAAAQESLLAAAFASVPGAMGMNNHMGSRATADTALMTTVLGYLKSHGLFYLDSRTTADTVGPRVARELGVPFVQRDVFVDVDTAGAEVDAAFTKGISEARSRGAAVVIGHVQNPSVAAILRLRARSLAGDGVRLARLGEVMAKEQGETAR